MVCDELRVGIVYVQEDDGLSFLCTVLNSIHSLAYLTGPHRRPITVSPMPFPLPCKGMVLPCMPQGQLSFRSNEE